MLHEFLFAFCLQLRMALGSLKEEHSSVVAVWLSLVADILCGCLNLI
jgi:hypothetical protein